MAKKNEFQTGETGETMTAVEEIVVVDEAAAYQVEYSLKELLAAQKPAEQD